MRFYFSVLYPNSGAWSNECTGSAQLVRRLCWKRRLECGWTMPAASTSTSTAWRLHLTTFEYCPNANCQVDSRPTGFKEAACWEKRPNLELTCTYSSVITDILIVYVHIYIDYCQSLIVHRFLYSIQLTAWIARVQNCMVFLSREKERELR